MIICHKYRFIFIKTKKTAGTSMEIALSKFCDANDILTNQDPEDEELRRKMGYQGPANFIVPKSAYSAVDWARVVTGAKPLCYYNHIPAWRIRKWIGPEIWDSYYKFCVERNPWDRAISAYNWVYRNMTTKPDFSDFIQHRRRKHYSNFRLYSIHGKIVVDDILRYENLANEAERLVERLGLPGKLELPRAKGDIRTDRRPYQEIIGPRERDLIAKQCVREIVELGYEF